MTRSMLLVLVFGLSGIAKAAHEVKPQRETENVVDQGDSDDPAIWIDPHDAKDSLILGTYKEGGLAVFDVKGKLLQYLGGVQLNNVDLVQGDVSGREIDLAFATNRADNTVAMYQIDRRTRQVELKASFPVDFELYGICASLDDEGKVHVVLPTKTGAVYFYEAAAARARDVELVYSHSYQLSTQSEGCVIDGASGRVFVSEEDQGLWSLPLAATDQARPRLLDRVESAGGRLTPDVEGVTIMRAEQGNFVIVSSQGDDKFLVFDLEAPHAYRGKFEIKGSDEIDRVTETDGIAAAPGDFGDGIRNGMLVVHDDKDDQEGKNFKIVSWKDVARELGL